MTILKKKIEKIITKKGPISIADFMNIALADEINGYYRKKMLLGSKGDFITSPDISQIFGEILGIWILDLWIKLEKPKNIQIVALGGGRVTLLRDIRKVLGDKIQNYVFIDITVELIKLQKKAVKGALHFKKIEDIPNLKNVVDLIYK